MYFMRIMVIIFILAALVLHAEIQYVAAQDDTVLARECLVPPVLDAVADDACWDDAVWQPIDQLWIPWGDVMDETDFSGRYKVTWSPETDNIYFLVEIIDDVLVDGYKYPMSGYYNWDVVEIFFDEDASGGDHKLNQNAFAYHITAGNDKAEFEVMDLAASWEVVNYSDHFDGMIKERDGKYIWELAMEVYSDSYDPDRQDNTPLELTAGKISGLSIAYCDNDNPDENPKTRDNFIGSVAVPQANSNDHWMNADWFGTLKLVEAGVETRARGNTVMPNQFLLRQNFPNPFNPVTTVEYVLPEAAIVSLAVYNALGRQVRLLETGYKQAGLYRLAWDSRNDAFQPVKSGLYILSLVIENNHNQFTLLRKMILLR